MFFIISSLQYSLFAVRLFIIVYFIIQAVRYSRYSSGYQKDNFTLATFILMIVSTSMHFIAGVTLLTVKLLYRLKDLDEDWLREHGN